MFLQRQILPRFLRAEELSVKEYLEFFNLLS